MKSSILKGLEQGFLSYDLVLVKSAEEKTKKKPKTKKKAKAKAKPKRTEPKKLTKQEIEEKERIERIKQFNKATRIAKENRPYLHSTSDTLKNTRPNTRRWKTTDEPLRSSYHKNPKYCAF